MRRSKRRARIDEQTRFLGLSSRRQGGQKNVKNLKKVSDFNGLGRLEQYLASGGRFH